MNQRRHRQTGECSQVTQRPGCNCFATSVSTLTGGSQATVDLRSEDRLIMEGAAGPLRASLAAGIRITTEVAERLSSRSDIVRVCTDAAAAVARSVLAARLMVASEVAAGARVPVKSRVPARSRPHATAPKASETVIAAKIPFDNGDMIRLPTSRRPMAIIS
jgi:hypothetical protein